MAFGLPVEGEEGPFLGELAEAAPTCDVDGTVADARQVLADSEAPVVVVVFGDGMAVGEVDEEALAGHPDDDPLLDRMRPVPSTVRPSVTVESVAAEGGGARLVTTSDGLLLGVATVEAGEHHHDHDHDHDHDHGAEGGTEEYEEELAAVLKAVEERFGGEEPSDDELRAFLRERLVAEGRTEEEADHFLEEMEGGG